MAIERRLLLVDAVLDDATTVGVVGQSSLTIHRAQRGAFERFIEITRQP